MNAATRQVTERMAVRADAAAAAAYASAEALAELPWLAHELMLEGARQIGRREEALRALMAAGLPGEVVTVSRGRIVRDTGGELVQAW